MPFTLFLGGLPLPLHVCLEIRVCFGISYNEIDCPKVARISWEMDIMCIGVWLVDIQVNAKTDSADYLETGSKTWTPSENGRSSFWQRIWAPVSPRRISCVGRFVCMTRMDLVSLWYFQKIHLFWNFLKCQFLWRNNRHGGDDRNRNYFLQFGGGFQGDRYGKVGLKCLPFLQEATILSR